MILKIEKLNKFFIHPWTLAKMHVLKDVSLEISKNSVVGFLGANGAGKTTTIKCMLGLLTYESGSIELFGMPHNDRSVKNQIGYLPERPFFYRYLSAEEFLRFYGQLSLKLSGKKLESRIDECLELVGLGHAKKYLIHQFSKGMLQRIGMAQALIHDPGLLVLDEPLSGLDPDGRIQLAEVINTVHSSGATVFFSSHLLDDVEKICRDLVVIRNGEVAYNGPKTEFMAQGVSSYSLVYVKNDQEFEEKLTDINLVQKRIDELRRDDLTIASVSPTLLSLEQAYKEFHKR